MPSLRKRSYEKELLDRDDISFNDIRRNMQELDRINTMLGGHAITIDGIKSLVSSSDDAIKIMEIGCGGGDNLFAIKKWAEANKIKVKLTGVDLNKECIAYARQQSRNAGIEFIVSDYRALEMESKPAIIFSSLFCHHFTDKELVEMMRWLRDHSTRGFFINDLHRNGLAYFSIKWITRFFSKSYLVKNDAPLSVRRGFVREDWKTIMAAAGIKTYFCKWKWAFRWLIVYQHDEQQTL